jgi:hypothetical protein
MQPSAVVLAFSAILLTSRAAGAQTAPGAAVASDSVEICVIVDGQLREIAAVYDAESGDTVVDGRPLAEAHPIERAPYLAGADWYAHNEMVEFEHRRYVRYGTPRVVRPAPLTRVGEFRDIPLFAESRSAAYRVVYALVDPGCTFQPFWYAATVGEVRGG